MVGILGGLAATSSAIHEIVNSEVMTPCYVQYFYGKLDVQGWMISKVLKSRLSSCLSLSRKRSLFSFLFVFRFIHLFLCLSHSLSLSLTGSFSSHFLYLFFLGLTSLSLTRESLVRPIFLYLLIFLSFYN